MSAGEEFVYEEVPYRLVRSRKRKRVGLAMTGDGVEVRIPERCAARHGHQFLQENIHWVREQLSRLQERVAEVPNYRYVFGECFPWLGSQFRLVRVERPADSGIFPGAICLYTRSRTPDAAQLQTALHKLYQREALELLTHKSARLASQLGLKFSAVRVRRTKSKWGHCSPQGELQYNWLICLAPEVVVDYLVAHEVCHLRHHNHSAAFWNLVGTVCPRYKILRHWLRDNGHRLHL